MWDPPTASQPGAFAFRMYRNYDGAGGQFGDVSVSATSTDQDKLAIYAAQRSAGGAVTIMVINKTSGTLNSAVQVDGFSGAGSAQVYRYDASDLGMIQHLSDVAVSATGFAAMFPANSITLLKIGAAGQTGGTSTPAPLPTTTQQPSQNTHQPNTHTHA